MVFDKNITKFNIGLFTTILVVSNFVENQLIHTELFNKSWINILIATIAGVLFHSLFTIKISTFINSKLLNSNIKLIIYDFIKYSTIFISQKLIITWIEGSPLVFNELWFMTYGLIILGYSIFYLSKDSIPKITTQYQPLFNDLLKITMGIILSNAFIDNIFSYLNLIKLFSIWCGLGIFHLVVKDNIISKESFSI